MVNLKLLELLRKGISSFSRREKHESPDEECDDSSYDHFINMKKISHYFKEPELRECQERVEDLKLFFKNKLKKRPYKEDELLALLNEEDPELSVIYDHISNMADFDFDDPGVPNYAALMRRIVEGIEVRAENSVTYWGLGSKLDSA